MAETHLGDVPVDSARLLIVDPCNLPADLVERLTRPNAHGVVVAVVAPTIDGDGMFPVFLDDQRRALSVEM